MLPTTLQLVLLAVVLPVWTHAACPTGWSRFEGSCYKVYAQKGNYLTSENTCESAGAHLADLGNQRENFFVLGLLDHGGDRNHGYIGLNDHKSEGNYVWSNGDRLEGATHTNWEINQPNNWGESDCVILRSEFGDWNDVPCHEKYYAICERAE